jgi:hypothetical protein
LGGRPAVEAGVGGRRGLLGAPRGRVAEDELTTELEWSATGIRTTTISGSLVRHWPAAIRSLYDLADLLGGHGRDIGAG